MFNFSIGQWISIAIVVLVALKLFRVARSLWHKAITIVMVLVLFGGYSLYDAVVVPYNAAKNAISTLPVEQVKENVRFENFALSVKINEEWYSLKDISISLAPDNSEIYVGYKDKTITVPSGSSSFDILNALRKIK